MNIELVNRIKRITLIALASDDELVETLVLKGGNAIELAYFSTASKISRTSYDLDYSIEKGDFTEPEEEIALRLKSTLERTFMEHGFVVIDFKFFSRPHYPQIETADFWGGYKVEFKVVEKVNYESNSTNIDKMRRSSVVINPNNSPIFELEFSKFEFIGEKKAIELDGYKIYVYTPEMIVFEKLRAICQQIPEYKVIVPSFNSRARARDFYDIFIIMDSIGIDPNTDNNLELIVNIFAAKKVPISFISKIRENYHLHVDNWKSVVDTVPATEQLNDFDFYFNFVLDKIENLKFP